MILQYSRRYNIANIGDMNQEQKYREYEPVTFLSPLSAGNGGMWLRPFPPSPEKGCEGTHSCDCWMDTYLGTIRILIHVNSSR